MSGNIIGSLIIWLIAIIVVIVMVVYMLNWLYFRSNRGVAFVRTGLGGEKVVINGGALVLPIIHEITEVNLNVVRIPVVAIESAALISRDRMRVDIKAEFFVRVIQQPESVSNAASTLGRRTTEPDQLVELLSGKFIGSLRAVASQMTLDEMHENRESIQTRLEERAIALLSQNGLELESVAITELNQTDLEFFNPSNRFDAEGMTELIETIESRRKLRNDIEQSSMVAIRERNLAAEKEALKLEQESENSRLEKERQIEAIRAEQKADIQKSRVSMEADAERTRIETEHNTKEMEIDRQSTLEATEIAAREEVEKVRIAKEKSTRTEQIKQRQSIEHEEIRANEQLELARMEQEKNLQTARVERDKIIRSQEISQDKSVQEAEISAHEELERARIASERDIHEARIEKERQLRRLELERETVLELAEIERQISILNKQVEQQSAKIKNETARAKAIEAEEQVNTSREQEIAERTAAVDKLIASKDAEVKKIQAEAEQFSEAIKTEAQRLRYEAENILSDNARAGILRDKLIERLEGIIRESAKPMEQIEGIKILHVDGVSNTGSASKLSPTDEVIDSILRYRAQAPLIDEMMKEVGIPDPNVSRGMGEIFRAAKDAKGLIQPTKEDVSPSNTEEKNPDQEPKG
ncbi:MAG: SPFH domain-containing protein [Gammaproteobacteria bacterium]|nr:SPFH domain-containing protein [Gammaproteobacteria bacterium]